MPNCTQEQNVYSCMQRYSDTEWDMYNIAGTPNPLLYTDAMYMFNYIAGRLLEDDLKHFEHFVRQHLWSYNQKVPGVCLTPTARLSCNCRTNQHMHRLCYSLSKKHHDNHP